MTAAILHIPDALHWLAFAALLVILTLGYLVDRTLKNAPNGDDLGYESSSDERFRLGCEQGAEKRGGRL